MVKIQDMWMHPGPQPNGCQAVPDGLWIIDQRDNHLYKLDYRDGSIIEKLPTETDRSSGVTLGGGYIWVASTYNCLLYRLNMDGTTSEKYDTPGKGIVAFARDPASARVTGAHGMEWIDDDNMWVAVPPAQRVYLMEPGTMKVKHSIPSPDVRPHGLFMHQGYMWLADTGIGKIHKLNPDSGEVLDEIDVPEPEVHGMTLHDGNIWFCCAETRRVCTIPLPA
jgi:streptogramin lyase